MTAQNPTPDDMRIIASNLKSEGQTSRAEVIEAAAQRLEDAEKVMLPLRNYLHRFTVLIGGRLGVKWEHLKAVEEWLGDLAFPRKEDGE